MKLKTLKTETEVREAADQQREGNRVSATVRDGSITEVRVGGLVMSSEYGMRVSSVIEFEEKEMSRVRVDHPAFPSLNRYFDSDYDATKFREQYDNIDGATVDHRKVTVQVDDSGKVLAEVGEDSVIRPLTPQDNGDDIPF